MAQGFLCSAALEPLALRALLAQGGQPEVVSGPR
jgi:hypothetical protein